MAAAPLLLDASADPAARAEQLLSCAEDQIAALAPEAARELVAFVMATAGVDLAEEVTTPPKPGLALRVCERLRRRRMPPPVRSTVAPALPESPPGAGGHTDDDVESDVPTYLARRLRSQQVTFRMATEHHQESAERARAAVEEVVAGLRVEEDYARLEGRAEQVRREMAQEEAWLDSVEMAVAAVATHLNGDHTHLWSSGYGTPAYAQGWVTGILDRCLARLSGFAEVRLVLAVREASADHLRGEVERLRGRWDAIRLELDARLETAIQSGPVKSLLDAESVAFEAMICEAERLSALELDAEFHIRAARSGV
jgi:hypothetical protein